MLQIEKVVKLLDDFHLGQFRTYVKNLSIRSFYPLSLVDVIDRDPNVSQDSNFLYKQVYGELPDGEKDMKKFFQLAHYTFKLTRYLAWNHPAYLQTNFARIEEYINSGQAERAFTLAGILWDIAEKVEDHPTMIRLAQIFIQKEVLQESASRTLEHHARLGKLLQHQLNLNAVFEHLHTHFGAKGKTKDDWAVDPYLDFFRQYVDSDYFVLQATARFCICYALYYVKDSRFYGESTFLELESLEQDLEKNEYVIFPYMFTLHHRLAFLKVHYRLREMNRELLLSAADQLMQGSADIQYWNSFVNLPEIFSIGIKTSHFLSNHFTSYREEHPGLLGEEILAEIEDTREHCRQLLANPQLEEKYILRYINLSYMYAGLLLLGSREEMEQSIDLLNSLLLTYQQVPFHQVIDPIYAVMIMAHFSLGEHDELTKSYNRYRKATKGKAVNPENDLAIQGLYYLSRWRATGRDQYVRKFSAILEESNNPNLHSTHRLLTEVASYFEMLV